MPPKKKGIWRESKDSVDGWPYVVHDYGLVKVGKDKNGPHKQWTVRLTSFDVVDPDDAAAHKECVRLERLARGLPYTPFWLSHGILSRNASPLFFRMNRPAHAPLNHPHIRFPSHDSPCSWVKCPNVATVH